MSRAICTNDRIMHIARNPRQVRIARKVQKVHIPRNMYPNGQNAMLCDNHYLDTATEDDTKIRKNS